MGHGKCPTRCDLLDAEDFKRAADVELVLAPQDEPLQVFQRNVCPAPQAPGPQVMMPEKLTARQGVGFQVSLHV